MTAHNPNPRTLQLLARGWKRLQTIIGRYEIAESDGDARPRPPPLASKEGKYAGEKGETQTTVAAAVEAGEKTAEQTTSQTLLHNGPANAKDESWTLSTGPFFLDEPRRVVLQAKVIDWTYINVTIYLDDENVSAPSFDEPKPTLPADAAEEQKKAVASGFVDEVLAACKQQYGLKMPCFAASVQARRSRDSTGNTSIRINDDMDDSLLEALSSAQAELESIPNLPDRISRTAFKPVVEPGQFFLPNTRLVRYRGELFVAKGPIYVTRVHDDFLEIRNLLALPSKPRHPNIATPPAALVTVSETDKRICGFLTPYHCNGNLDGYARRLRDSPDSVLDEALLLRWFRQLVDAMMFLESHGTWHGDIKPDNLVVTGAGDLVLIDFVRLFATFATASPEVRRYCRQNLEPEEAAGESRTEGKVEEKKTGVPGHWALDRIIRSEVYSIGRTMYLVCEGVSMMDVYREHGWVSEEKEDEFPTRFGENSTTPLRLREVISRCCEPEPAARISLEELSATLERMAS